MRVGVVAVPAPIRLASLVAWAPFGALALAALERPLRTPVLVILIAWYLSSRARDGRPGAILTAAIPIGLVLAFGAPMTPEARPGALDCAAPLSPPAAWRGLVAVVVLVVTVLLSRSLGHPTAELGWRWPRGALVLASVAIIVVGGAALVGLGEIFARPFFGELTFTLVGPGLILPALLFAMSNAVAEETAYRGAVLAWLGPGLGPAAASAVIFGLAHTGPDFVASPLPIVLAMIATSLVAWVVLRRTRSLALLIAVHAAADIPLYLFMACRAAN